MRRRRVGFATLTAMLLLGGVAGSFAGIPAARAEEIVVTVTSAGDAEDAVCPDAASCTLRRAIEFANADESGATVTITFDPVAFPAETPATIAPATPLPVLTADAAVVSGAGAGVVLDGGGLAEPADGLVASGDGNVVRGLAVAHFPGGACIRATGASAIVGGPLPAHGNLLGACATGVRAEASAASVENNVIGFAPDGVAAAQVDTGVDVRAGSALIEANTIGNAIVAIRVAGGDATAVVDNVVGEAPDGRVAGVARGLAIETTASETFVSNNTFRRAGRAIVVEPDAGGFSSTGNRFRLNSYVSLDEVEIDLGNDGIRNVNDPGDEDSGPNGMINSPEFFTVTQSTISGSACEGCFVDLYLVAHEPGGAGDHATTRMAAGTTVANGTGIFSFASPPVTPGTWISAIATHPVLGTSEFSRPARVGAGIVQCGSVELEPGWMHAGYFGPTPIELNASFPPEDAGAVDVIYEYVESDGAFAQWLDGGQGATLGALDPGEAYWYHAIEPTAIAGGLSLTVPVPAHLVEGWNDFVYLGASVPVLDALSSIAGKYAVVYEFLPGPDGGAWRTYAGDAVPAWVNTLSQIQACGAYQVQMTADATLLPFQP